MRVASLNLALIRRFKADEHGVSAVEFALILPILILLLFASFDVTRAVDAKNKSVLLSRTIADFVSQSNGGVDKTELANIIKASKFILYPYSDASDVLTINIQSVNQVQQTPPKYEIDWSYPPADSSNRVTTDAPPDTSSIRADVTYTYRLKFVGYLTGRLGFDHITLTSSTNMSPRFGTPVTAKGW
jgi:Flp pilus assembly protein TadG